MFKTRLRKWGLFKYRTASQIQEDLCNRGSCLEPNGASSVAGNNPEIAPCGLHHQDLANIRRYVGCQGYWNQSTGLCVEFPDSTSGGIGEDRLLPGQRRRRRQATRVVPLSVPAVLRAPSDLQCLEEATRIANNYIQGSIESGAWTYDEQLHGIFGHRGLAGWEDTFAWLGRLVEGIQYIQCARTREGFRLLNACLDGMAARLRYQDATTMYYFLVFTKIQNRPLRRALVRHIQELAQVVLGSRHPFPLVFQRLAWREARAIDNDNDNNNSDSESAATPARFTELIGVKHSFFDKPLRLCPAVPKDSDTGAAAAAAAQERYASTVVGADAGYAHVFVALEEASKLVELARILRGTLWQNDPGEPVGSIIAFDTLLAITRGLRLHGERAEATATLETVRRWLNAMDPEIAGMRVRHYYRELKELRGVGQGVTAEGDDDGTS